ncbi:MAG TPA: Na+/H+ antiporter subunit E [Burkholderiales bacterium]
MKRWLPYPLLVLLLTGMWLLLNQTLDPGHVVLGAAVGIASARAYARLQTPDERVRWRAVLPLAWLVLIDIVRSNIAVARIVLSLGARKQTSDFLDIPVELRSRAGLAVLACIITATPGTAWVRYDPERSVVTIHVLDLIDREAWIRTIKGRYERRLREIFE